jgi:hypothetical protein
VKTPNAAAKLPPLAFELKSRAIGGQLEPLVRPRSERRLDTLAVSWRRAQAVSNAGIEMPLRALMIAASRADIAAISGHFQ